jgi:hypothetical protein
MSNNNPEKKKRKSYVLKAEAGKIKFSPFGFQYYASEFLNTARAHPARERFTPVPYYLYCRSLELSLKAFLLLKGKSINFVKEEIRHDLLEGLKEAKKLDIDKLVLVEQREEKELKKANKYYVSKSFEYVNITKSANGYPGLPNLDILDDLAGRLVENLYQPCKDA